MSDIQSAAANILECCKADNIEKVYCCITRLRLKFKDKSIVDLEGLRTNEMVQGIFWYGDECQLVIGLEVFALNETIDLYLSKNR